MDRVTAAEQEINRILAELEQHTDSVVKSIAMHRIEVTSIDSDRPMHRAGVKIELERLPGHQWNLST